MRTRFPLLAAAACFAACSDDTSTPNGAIVVGTDQVAAIDFGDSFAQQQAVLWVIADSFDPSDANTAVAEVARNVSAFFSPRGCINSSSGGDSVTLRANHCAGPPCPRRP
jgi:hypothetical protein